MIELIDRLITLAMEAVSQGNIGVLAALFLVSALTEVGVPFPFVLDSVLFLTTFQSGLASVQVPRILLVLLVGRIVGASVIYWLTRLVGSPFLDWLARRFPAFQDRLCRVITRFNARAMLAVAVARLTPGLLTLSTVSSGCVRLRYQYFVMGIVLSSVLADGALIGFGVAARYGLKTVGLTPRTWILVIAFVVAASLMWFLGQFLLRRKSGETRPSQ